MGDEHAVRVELLQTERARNVPEQQPDRTVKPITPARARRNRDVLEAALRGIEDDEETY
jgi:hypothetical protein